MKKICVITSVHNKDDGRIYQKEIKSLVSAGYDIYYMVNDVNCEYSEGIKYVEIGKKNSRFRRILSFYSIYKKAKNLKCDIYHIHDPELMLVGFLLKQNMKTKIIYDVHEDNPSQILQKDYLPKWLRRPLANIMKRIEKVADRKFDAIIVADNFVYKSFKNKNTVIIYNFPIVEEFEKYLKNEIIKEYDIIFPGTMSYKTAEILIQITKCAMEKGYLIKCLIISNFQFNGGIDRVRDAANKIGLATENFVLMDFLPSNMVPQYMQKSRIGLIPLSDTPKYQKNIPTKLFEYMLCSIPVIASDLLPSKQFIEGNNIGYLVPADAVEDYADRIIELICDKNKADKMGEVGQVLVREKYNWKSEEAKLLYLYNTLTNN